MALEFDPSVSRYQGTASYVKDLTIRTHIPDLIPDFL